MTKVKRMSKAFLSMLVACMLLVLPLTPTISAAEQTPNKVIVTFSGSAKFYDDAEFAELEGDVTLATSPGHGEKQLTTAGAYYTYVFYVATTEEDWTMPALDITSTPSDVAGYTEIDAENNSVKLKIPRTKLAKGVTINVTAKAPVETFNVTLPANTTSFKTDKPGVNTVDKGSPFEFTVTPQGRYATGYEPYVLVNSVEKQSTSQDGGYKYKLDSVNEDTEVLIELVPKTFHVKKAGGDWSGVQTTLVDGNGEAVSYGQSYSFTLAAKPGYTLAETPVTIQMGAQSLTEGTGYSLVNGTYTIKQVTDDVTVTLKPATAQKFKVSWKDGTAYIISSEQDAQKNSIQYLGSFTFSVQAKPGYSIDDIVVSANGQPLTDQGDHSYTISNITADQIITVTGAQQKTYTVSVATSDEVHYTFSAQGAMYNIPHGSTFTFTVTPEAGYTIDKVEVKKGGETVRSTNQGNVYTVTVEDNLTITVTTKQQQYTLTANSGAGYQLTGNNGSYLSGSIAELTITAEKGYTITGVYTVVNGVRTVVYDDGAGKYSFAVTADNMSVAVTVETIKYTVTYQNSKGQTTTKTYDVNSGVDLSGETPKITVDIADPVHDYYTFEGWSNGDNGTVKHNGKITLDADATSVTVSAQWTLKLDKLKTEEIAKNILSNSTISYDDVYQQLIVKVTWNLGSLRQAISEVYDADYDILSVGIIYSDREISDADWHTQVEALTAENNWATETAGNEVQAGARQYLYYYVDGNDFAEQAASATFKFGGTVSGDRYAIGWITIRVGNETVTLYSNAQHYSSK